MKKIEKRKYADIFIGIVVFVIIIICGKYDWQSVNSYKMYNNSTLRYVSGRVISVESENLEKDDSTQRYYGVQELKVYIKEGAYKGQEVLITNYLSTTTNVLGKKGMNVIVCVDVPENASPYFTIYNYDRNTGLWIVIGAFCLALILVGGRKGIKAMAALMFTIIAILFFLVQGIFHGVQIVPFSIVTLIVVTVLALVILNGLEKKTILFACATLSGLVVAAVFCAFSQKLLYINGYNFSEVESLLLIRNSTGLEIKNLLFAGVLISSLGAVMDVAVSIVSALYEVKKANPKQSRKTLFLSGMQIGKDMIGTMSNTLILAFTGTSLTTILLLLAFGYQMPQLLNSDYFMLELVRGISSTFAVVMTVPAASAISAVFISDR